MRSSIDSHRKIMQRSKSTNAGSKGAMNMATPYAGNGMKTAIGAIVVAAVLALAPAAAGQSSSEQGYGGQAQAENQVQQGAAPAAPAQAPAAAPSAAPSGVAGLPFSGLDLIAMAGGGLVLVMTGIGLSRLQRSES